MAKSVTGFRLSDAELKMIDDLADRYRLDNRTETLQWVIRQEYFKFKSLEQRIIELESELGKLKALAK